MINVYMLPSLRMKGKWYNVYRCSTGVRRWLEKSNSFTLIWIWTALNSVVHKVAYAYASNPFIKYVFRCHCFSCHCLDGATPQGQVQSYTFQATLLILLKMGRRMNTHACAAQCKTTMLPATLLIYIFCEGMCNPLWDALCMHQSGVWGWVQQVGVRVVRAECRWRVSVGGEGRSRVWGWRAEWGLTVDKEVSTADGHLSLHPREDTREPLPIVKHLLVSLVGHVIYYVLVWMWFAGHCDEVWWWGDEVWWWGERCDGEVMRCNGEVMRCIARHVRWRSEVILWGEMVKGGVIVRWCGVKQGVR